MYSFFFLIHRQQHLIMKYKYLTINVLHHLQKRKFGSTATYFNNLINNLMLKYLFYFFWFYVA